MQLAGHQRPGDADRLGVETVHEGDEKADGEDPERIPRDAPVDQRTDIDDPRFRPDVPLRARPQVLRMLRERVAPRDSHADPVIGWRAAKAAERVPSSR